MLLFILDPISLRIYSALYLLLAIRAIDLNQLGIYSLMTLALTGFQTVFDTNFRTFFLNSSSIGIDIGYILKKYRTYYLIPSTSLLILSVFEIVFHNASLQFILFAFIPFSWIFTQEIHICALRGSDNARRYLRLRIVVTLLMNTLGLVLFWKMKQIFLLIVVQGLVEIAIWSLMRKEIGGKTAERGVQFKVALRNHTLISFASWIIALWERFILGFLILPSDFAKWSIMNVAFRGPVEALGTGISSWLRSTFARLSSSNGRSIIVALRLNIFGCTILLIAIKLWIFEFAQRIFPLMAGYQNLCLILVVSAQVSVSFWILNSSKIFQSDFKSNTVWASIVFITSPVTAFCLSRSLVLGSAIVLVRDIFLIFNKRMTKFPPKYRMGFVAVVTFQILVILL